MDTSFISTRSLQAAPRTALADQRLELARVAREISIARLDDPGRVLGARTGETVNIRIEDSRAAGYIVAGGLADVRLGQTQQVLDDVIARANTVMESLIALPPSSTAITSLVTEARGALDALVAQLNTSDGRSYLFGGINSAARPVADFDGAPSAAVDAALVNSFGVPNVPPATTPAAMDAFLAGDFAAVFAPAGWAADWSVASDEPVTVEIDRGRVVDVSVSANAEPFRDLARAYTMLADLDIASLRSDTRQTVIDEAAQIVGQAITGVVAIQAELGIVEREIGETRGRLEDEQTLLRTRLDELVGVDPAEAKTRADRLTTQIEMSYALTIQLNRLSILNFA